MEASSKDTLAEANTEKRGLLDAKSQRELLVLVQMYSK